MIDEKKLIDFIDAGKFRNPDELYFSENDVVRLIKNFAELSNELGLNEQPKTDWIPCEERLPEINKKVLVTIWCHRVEKGFLSHTGKWFVITEDGIDEATVIAWQPLPAPYKKEGAE